LLRGKYSDLVKIGNSVTMSRLSCPGLNCDRIFTKRSSVDALSKYRAVTYLWHIQSEWINRYPKNRQSNSYWKNAKSFSLKNRWLILAVFSFLQELKESRSKHSLPVNSKRPCAL